MQTELEQAIEEERALAKEHNSFVESITVDGIMVATGENAKRLAELHRREKDIKDKIRELLDQ
ncbi:hypothetical protein [Hyphomicrobium sp.]|uniref:hypothetical protein n=1 Tax=Hyphomicrobium sp. TaxID=82 RepID=UPI001D6A0352|nr:hypothetical protein [Hyphomicrobium sp.]MBY0561795.1 hypothetical protein [Hyphomicrobium sp.]